MSIEASKPEKRVPYIACAEETCRSLTGVKSTRKHLQLSTDNKTCCYNRLHLATARLSKDQRNQVIGVLKAGSMVFWLL